jgi:hypothetical protein
MKCVRLVGRNLIKQDVVMGMLWRMCDELGMEGQRRRFD